MKWSFALWSKKWESVAGADWIYDAVHDFFFVTNSIYEEDTEVCGCMFARYKGSICEFDGRLFLVQSKVNAYMQIKFHIMLKLFL